jgi:glutamate-1-semialdehyde aminotransferase
VFVFGGNKRGRGRRLIVPSAGAWHGHSDGALLNSTLVNSAVAGRCVASSSSSIGNRSSTRSSVGVEVVADVIRWHEDRPTI